MGPNSDSKNQKTMEVSVKPSFSEVVAPVFLDLERQDQNASATR